MAAGAQLLAMINLLLAGFVRYQGPRTGLDGWYGARAERLHQESWEQGLWVGS